MKPIVKSLFYNDLVRNGTLHKYALYESVVPDSFLLKQHLYCHILQHALAAIYSASAEDKVIEYCFLDFQEISADLRN